MPVKSTIKTLERRHWRHSVMGGGGELSIANVALSILYIRHPNKHNNQQFNVKAILQQKKKIPIHVKLGVT